MPNLPCANVFANDFSKDVLRLCGGTNIMDYEDKI